MRIKSKADLHKALGSEKYALDRKHGGYFNELFQDALVTDKLILNMDNPEQLIENTRRLNEDINRLLSPFKVFIRYHFQSPDIDQQYKEEQIKKVGNSYKGLIRSVNKDNLSALIQKLIFLQATYQLILPQLPDYQDIKRDCQNIEKQINKFITSLVQRGIDSTKEIYDFKMDAIKTLSEKKYNISSDLKINMDEQPYSEKFLTLDQDIIATKDKLEKLNSQYSDTSSKLNQLNDQKDLILKNRKSLLLDVAQLYCQGDVDEGLKTHDEYYFNRIFGDYFDYNEGEPKLKNDVDVTKFDEILNTIFTNCQSFRNRFFTKRQCGLIAQILTDKVNDHTHSLGMEISQGNVRKKESFKFEDDYYKIIKNIKEKQSQIKDIKEGRDNAKSNLQSLYKKQSEAFDQFDRDASLSFARRGRIKDLIDGLFVEVLDRYSDQLDDSTVERLKQKIQYYVEDDYSQYTFFDVSEIVRNSVLSLIDRDVLFIIDEQNKKKALLYKFIQTGQATISSGGAKLTEVNQQIYAQFLASGDIDFESSLPSTIAMVLNSQQVINALSDSTNYNDFKSELAQQFKEIEIGSSFSRHKATQALYDVVQTDQVDIEQAVENYYQMACVQQEELVIEEIKNVHPNKQKVRTGIKERSANIEINEQTIALITDVLKVYLELCKNDYNDATFGTQWLKKSPQDRFNAKLSGYAYVKGEDIFLEESFSTMSKLSELFISLSDSRPIHKELSVLEEIFINALKEINNESIQFEVDNTNTLCIKPQVSAKSHPDQPFSFYGLGVSQQYADECAF
ncbi:hypothetical protein L3V83_08750 [Thiotrichales bacterium 19X7-9]|nr:hypothetical protein [Thiotrichales bacterium 19X7-9]